jgi:AcrR family transcriptional regulator
MTSDPFAATIVDTAIAMAEEAGWESVRLRRVAARLEVPLTEVLARFRDLDAVADAWFQRGWDAMLAPTPEGFAERLPRERIELLLLRWFDALARHRRVTGQMLRTKIYPSHPTLGAADFQPVADHPVAQGRRRARCRGPAPAGRGSLAHRFVHIGSGPLGKRRLARAAADARRAAATP